MLYVLSEFFLRLHFFKKGVFYICSSSGRGAIPHWRYSPRPAFAAESVQFRHQQYSLDERGASLTSFSALYNLYRAFFLK